MLVNRESISFSRKIILVNKKAPCTIKKELSKRSNNGFYLKVVGIQGM